MPAPRILFVKLSSLGDVVHHLPAVTDLAEHEPGARLGWAVEEAFAGLVKLHPAISEAIPVSLRSIRRNPLSTAPWKRLAAARRSMGRGHWDYVVDTQGLLKSAIVTRFASTAAFGLDSASAREAIASRFYDVKLFVPRGLHAVERNRRLVGQVFGYTPRGKARYGLARPGAPPAWAPGERYVVMLHAASRAPKRWPEERWVDLGRMLSEQGSAIVFPGGSDEERASAARLASAVPNAIAAPAMGLEEAAALLGHASSVIGVDTGLTHLAVALGTPTVGIYCATNPELTGLHGGEHAVNVGAAGASPTVDAVAAALASSGAEG
ncbi:MAG TPA: lipopolysaccharide heptosyltransferase I [Usitatibacter sp.]|nr:lipopolysaccharide heptosyltransferase I [Usitatibacter sp.]